MRRRLSFLSQEEEEEQVNMTPMLDVVFIMLIFFIVTASFVKESGIDVNQQDAVTTVKKERATILIGINEAGEIWLDRRRIDVAAVRANVERLRAENPQGTVVIQVDKAAASGQLVKVMDAVREAGVYDIAIAAPQR